MSVADALPSVATAWLVALCACGRADASADRTEWTGTREVVDGVEVVRNPGPPLIDGTAVEVDLLWAAPSGPAEQQHGVWQDPSEIGVAGEDVYVLDRMARRVYVVGAATGRLRRWIGGEGAGPGELEDPFGLAVRNDEVVVGDRGGASLERFGLGGAYRGTLRLGSMGFALHGLGPDGFLVSSLLGREGSWKRVSPEGDITPFPWPTGTSATSDIGEECGRTSTAGPTVFRLSCRRIAFQVMRSDGTLEREVVVDRPLQPVPESEIEAHLDEIRALMQRSGLPPQLIQEQVERQRDRLHRNPRMRSVRLDRHGRHLAVWEQRPDDLGGGPAHIHLFSPDGVYLVHLAFERAWVDFAFDRQTLYALVRDPATDLARLVAYRVRLPS